MFKKIVFITIVTTLLLSTTVKAAIVDIVCTDMDFNPLPLERWSFDYDSQVLTLKDVVYEVGHQPYEIYQERTIRVRGRMDSESTFTIVENIRNKTALPLTGYTLIVSNTIITYNVILQSSIQATGSPEVHQETSTIFGLFWQEPIPDGESFVVQFDVFSDKSNLGILDFGINNTAIPEPATLGLLGLGGLVLLRNRKSINGKLKA